MTAQDIGRVASPWREADRPSHRQRPFGQRRSTPEGEASLRTASTFEGLPPGATRWRLAAALRAAARKLGLSAPMLALLEHYIDLTYDIDWTTGSEPIVFRPVIEIAEHFGRSERQIRNLETGLVRRGLLAWRDSGNHHRKGRRSRDGRIIYAYGASLGPLGARYDEILAQAQAARAEIEETRRLRIGIAALRRRLRAMLAETPDEAAAAAVNLILKETPSRAQAGTPSGALRSMRDVLASAVRLLETSWNTGQGEASVRHMTETTKEKTINGTQAEKPTHDGKPRIGTQRPPTDLNRIREQILQAAASTAIHAIDPIKTRDTLHDVASKAEKATTYYGISKGAWCRACHTSSRYIASMALIILARAVEDRPDTPVLNPNSYFMAIVDKIISEKVNVERTFRRLSIIKRSIFSKEKQQGDNAWP